MEKQVLSIEQMRELTSLGIDTSKASALWVAVIDKAYNPTKWIPVFRTDFTPIEVLREKFPLSYKEGNIYYAFTLQDILEMLPKSICNNKYCLNIDPYSWRPKWNIGYREKSEDRCLLRGSYGESGNPIDAAFIVLKWCKQNNYLND